MNNTRFLKIVIAVLILVNLGTLAFIWFSRPVAGTSDHLPPAEGFLVKELDLSGAQRSEYSRIRNDHRMMLRKLQEQDRVLHNRFFQQLFSEMPDMKMVHDLADSIAENRKKMEMLTYGHFKQVSSMLTPVQQKKFEEIFDDVLKMVLPLPPPPPVPEVPPLPPPSPPREK